MKKTIPLLFILTVLLLTGCQEVADQAGKIQNDASNAIMTGSQQAQALKNQVIDTKNKVDEKVTQAKELSDAFNKFTN